MTELATIRSACAKAFGVTVEDMRGHGRIRCLSMARRAYCKLAREMTDASFPMIANGICQSDHTTALYHVNSTKWYGFEEKYRKAQAVLSKRVDFSKQAARFKSRRSK